VTNRFDPQEPTGTCAVLVKGGERSLCANLAAANCCTRTWIEVVTARRRALSGGGPEQRRP